MDSPTHHHPPLDPQPSVHDKDELQGLVSRLPARFAVFIPLINHVQKNIREFLRVRTGYDVFPLSFRLIVLDNDLLIKKSLNILIQNCP